MRFLNLLLVVVMIVLGFLFLLPTIIRKIVKVLFGSAQPLNQQKKQQNFSPQKSNKERDIIEAEFIEVETDKNNTSNK